MIRRYYIFPTGILVGGIGLPICPWQIGTYIKKNFDFFLSKGGARRGRFLSIVKKSGERSVKALMWADEIFRARPKSRGFPPFPRRSVNATLAVFGKIRLRNPGG